jgi:hypothetical protein
MKWPGREADHAPPSKAKVKNEWSYIYTPPIRLYGWTWRTLRSFPLGVVIIPLASNTAWTHKSRRKKWISLCPRETPLGSYRSRKTIKISLGRYGGDENCVQLRSFCGTSKKRLDLLNNRHLFKWAVYHVVNGNKRDFFDHILKEFR